MAIKENKVVIRILYSQSGWWKEGHERSKHWTLSMDDQASQNVPVADVVHLNRHCVVSLPRGWNSADLRQSLSVLR